jgi:hypothetical protein
MVNNFQSLMIKHNLSGNDLADGMEYAIAHGWVEESGKGFKITSSGFSKA